MTPKRPTMTQAEVDALDTDLTKVMKSTIFGMSLKHGTDNVTVCQFLFDTLAMQIRQVSPDGTVDYLRALADVTEGLNNDGLIPPEAEENMKAAVRKIHRDTDLFYAKAGGNG